MKRTSKAIAAHLRIGRIGEETVARFFCRYMNYKLLAKNWRCRAGELDLVFLDGITLVFVEVKSRRFNPMRRPLMNLSHHQYKRDRNAVRQYMLMLGEPALPVRFDVVEVEFQNFTPFKITHHENYVELSWSHY